MTETKGDEAIIEAMQRAILHAEGYPPSDIERLMRAGKYAPYRDECVRQYAAHLAMLKAIEGRDRRAS